MADRTLSCVWCKTVNKTDAPRCKGCHRRIWKRKLIKFRCTRCKERWTSYLLDPPEVCPRCGSPFWNHPRLSRRERSRRIRAGLARRADNKL